MPRILPALLIAALLPGFATLADSDHLEARRLVKSGVILPLEEILKSVNEKRPGRVLEVEMERKGRRYIYEVELLDDYGRVWEMKIDAHTGRVLKVERED